MMLFPPGYDASLDRHHQAQAVLDSLLVEGDFVGGWRPEVLTMNALPRFLANFDEARQFLHAEVLRSTVERGVIDALFACRMLSHRSKTDAPIGCKT